MPILDIEIVGVDAGELPIDAGLTRRLADRAGEVLGTSAGRTWVKLRRLGGARYAENGVSATECPAPVFVHVLLADRPEEGRRATLARALSRAIGEETKRDPEVVHVLFEAAARGRVAFGGTLLE
jgi:phenylpyruvate tautomerase PptA (4-oxalocrotonate tautomerase family)